MLCSKCQTEAKSGKVKKGEFVCDSCLKAAKLKDDELVTRYAQAHTREGIIIVSAKYKAGAKYWIRKEFDPGWPFDEKKYMGYRRGGAPGHESKQAVINSIYSTRLQRATDAQKNLTYSQNLLAEIISFCKDNGYDLPEGE